MSKSLKTPAVMPSISAPRRRVSDEQRQILPSERRDSAFAQTCRQQAQAIAAGDPAGDELMQFVEQLYEWPEG